MSDTIVTVSTIPDNPDPYVLVDTTLAARIRDCLESYFPLVGTLEDAVFDGDNNVTDKGFYVPRTTVEEVGDAIEEIVSGIFEGTNSVISHDFDSNMNKYIIVKEI